MLGTRTALWQWLSGLQVTWLHISYSSASLQVSPGHFSPLFEKFLELMNRG